LKIWFDFDSELPKKEKLFLRQIIIIYKK
jgi:hypothetical protein